MTRDPLYTQLREAGWRRKLTSAEEAQLCAWLAANPQEQKDWEAETAMNDALARLPDVEVPSNFTARVLAAVERERQGAAHSIGHRRQPWRLGWNWLPRAALAALILGAGLVSYEYTRKKVERKQLAESVVAVSDVTSLPSPEVLQDFDAIRALNTTPPPDDTLLALFK
jgi:anti-sigma factor RsiW